MHRLVLSLVFLILAIYGVVLKKTYALLPELELKRRAENHDELAVRLYRAVTYGASLRALLWLYIGFSAAASLILLAKLLPIWAALIIVAPVLYIVFSLLPASRVSPAGLWLTRLATPIVVWLLNLLHPLLSWLSHQLSRLYKPSRHSGIFERHDLLSLINQLEAEEDSRLSREELETLKRALTFDELKVHDVLTPRKKVKAIKSSDTVGPVLINELHENHEDYVLVKEGNKGPVIGTLAFKDLSLESRGKVRDIMDAKLYYLNENDHLNEALHAFFITNHSLFVVVNDFEEYVGIVTIEVILKRLLGHIPGDDFEQYTDQSAVAKRHQSIEPADNQKEEVI